jgi:hypothetical protein
MSPEERLDYHQTQSGPRMKNWSNATQRASGPQSAAVDAVELSRPVPPGTGNRQRRIRTAPPPMIN